MATVLLEIGVHMGNVGSIVTDVAAPVVTLEIDVSQQDIDDFIGLSGDNASVHVDDGFAEAAGFDKRIVHGALIVAYISRFVGTVMPGRNSILLKYDLAFRSPCYAPDRIRIAGKIAKHHESVNVMVVAITVVNSKDVVIVDGETTHQLIKSAD